MNIFVFILGKKQKLIDVLSINYAIYTAENKKDTTGKVKAPVTASKNMIKKFKSFHSATREHALKCNYIYKFRARLEYYVNNKINPGIDIVNEIVDTVKEYNNNFDCCKHNKVVRKSDEDSCDDLLEDIVIIDVKK